jgi:hypothetical protein
MEARKHQGEQLFYLCLYISVGNKNHMELGKVKPNIHIIG